MSCDRAGRIDAETFLIEPRSSELAEFREHYPGCVDCSAVVKRWSALDWMVRDLLTAGGPNGGHPAPEELAQRAGARRDDASWAALDRHVASCDSCHAELTLIQRFDPESLRVAAGVPAEPEPVRAIHSPRTDWSALLGEGLESLARWLVPVRAPAFAAIALIVVLGLWSQTRPSDGTLGGGQPSGLALVGESESKSLAPAPVPSERPVERPIEVPATAAGRLALEAPRATGEDGSAQPAPQLAAAEPGPAAPIGSPDVHSPEPASPTLASPSGGVKAGPERSIELAAPSSRGAGDPTPPERVEPPLEPVREEILLAALIDLPSPSYAFPSDVEPVGWMREIGAVRAGPRVAGIEVLAPKDHTGLTLSVSPRLWWQLEEATEAVVRLTVMDEEAIDPILEISRPGPHAAGLHSFDLGEADIELAPGIEYRWFVSLVVDPDRPSRNPISAGALRLLEADDPRRAEVAAAAPAEQGHALARAGVWYDAYDFFASLAEANPDVSRLERHRERMVEFARADR